MRTRIIIATKRGQPPGVTISSGKHFGWLDSDVIRPALSIPAWRVDVPITRRRGVATALSCRPCPCGALCPPASTPDARRPTQDPQKVSQGDPLPLVGWHANGGRWFQWAVFTHDQPAGVACMRLISARSSAEAPCVHCPARTDCPAQWTAVPCTHTGATPGSA